MFFDLPDKHPDPLVRGTEMLRYLLGSLEGHPRQLAHNIVIYAPSTALAYPAIGSIGLSLLGPSSILTESPAPPPNDMYFRFLKICVLFYIILKEDFCRTPKRTYLCRCFFRDLLQLST
jgi:hypothetical protein